MHLVLDPLATNPPVEHLKRRLRLVVGHHVATSVEPHEGEVARGLDGASGLAVLKEGEVLERSLLVALLARPLESLGPGKVTEPVADEVSVSGVDEDWDLSKDARHKAVEGLHPVTGEQEVAVDVHVARVVAVDLGSEGLHDVLLVEPLLDPSKLVVAERVVAALLANVVWVHTSTLVRTYHSVSHYTSPTRTRKLANQTVVAVDRSRHA